jgi:nucleotidyltransferase/DNA polymerase involved in DNA repair
LLRWLVLDLNSFFASCEQQEDPELRDRSVIVVPTMADTARAIAPSYPAKGLGIKTGTLAHVARLPALEASPSQPQALRGLSRPHLESHRQAHSARSVVMLR